MKLDINNYPGSKDASGVQPAIINRIPKHRIFVEMFGGSGKTGINLIGNNSQVMILEKSENVAVALQEKYHEFLQEKKLQIGWMDSIGAFLYQFRTFGVKYWKDCFFFFDPPYLFETRKGQRNLYDHEWTAGDHVIFFMLINEYFSLARKDKINCMITHPRCELYEKNLSDWFSVDIEYQTRGGMMKDTIWMNYDITQMELACTDYIGETFIDRQAFKRKKNRWVKRLNQMPMHEKQAMLEHIQNNCR